MKFRTRHKATAALGAALAFLLLSASPASAAVATGEIVDGDITVVANYGLGTVAFDLSGGTPHACSDPNAPQPTIDVDIVGNGTSGTTEVVDTDFNRSYADFGGTTYALDIGLAAGGNQTGTYAGGSSPYVVAQGLGLNIAVYETSNCVAGALACNIGAQFALAGDFTGVISPPATGDLVLDGAGTLATSSCSFLLALAFNGASATVNGLTVRF